MRWPTLFRKAAPLPAVAPGGVSGVGAAAVPAALANGFYVEGSTGPSAYLTRTNSEISKEYHRNEYLWRCVDLIATTASSIPLYLETGSDRKPTAAEAQVERLISSPNPQWTGEALRYFLSASLALTNRAFLFQVFGVGRTIELWPINPTQVTVNYAAGSGVIVSFTVTEGGRQRTYIVQADGRCEIIMFNRPTMGGDSDFSPAAVASPSAEAFNKILQRCVDMARNASNMTGVLHTKNELTQEAVVKVKDKLDTYKAGESNSGSVMVTANGEWTFTRISEDPAPALNVDVKDSMARDVAITMGVPTQLVGIKGNDTYNNINQARVAFVSETVIPGYLRFIVAQLNAVYLSGSGTIISIDTDALPAMVEARTALIDSASKATMLSINEQREMLGFAKSDDPMADIPVQLIDLALRRLQVEVGQGDVAGNLPAGAET